LKEKSQGLYAFKNFCAKVEFLFTPLKLLVLCNNQGGEYVSREFFFFFCIEANITHKLTQAYRSSHNGVLKCKNYTLKKFHSMVVNAHIPKLMWLALQIILQIDLPQKLT